MRSERLTLFNYFGGKARFCKEIADLLDYDHTDIYIEPFGGAASVLLNKPVHEMEFYSDVSRGLVALMTCLSDPNKSPELIDCLYDTVYSADCFRENLEYRNSIDDLRIIKEKDTTDELKLAVATYVVYSMSRDGMGTAFSASKFRSNEAYYKQVDRLYRVAERLKGVEVIGAVGALTYLLNNSYLNEEKAMFYIDAPYLSADEDEKNLGICYKGQMELSDHRLLLDTISTSKAKFLISNYDTPVYNEYLKDWTKVTIDTVTGVGGKTAHR